ncbi:MAG: hypothetical protein ACRDHE_15330, partial [Ktedonobacterales bacterium]
CCHCPSATWWAAREDGVMARGPLSDETLGDETLGDETLDDETLGDETLARRLRAIATTCAPPVGVGSFDILYVNDRELVVWYSPVRDNQQPGEVAIARSYLRAAWRTLMERGRLDEADLIAVGESNKVARWLLAVLAQAPGVSFVAEPVALEWRAVEAVAIPTSEPGEETRADAHGRKARARKRGL